jgi:hypothetical protein
LAEKKAAGESDCPTSEDESAVERITGSSENCGKVHDKTISAKSDGNFVRGSGLSAWIVRREWTSAIAACA